jgi:osmotically-inducible protein OsmY
MELRERNVMQRRCLQDRGAARRQIEANDVAHRQVLQAAFGVDREDARLYDLVLNTERISVDACVGLARSLLASPEFGETEASRTILGDRVLEASIRTRLAERFTIGTGIGQIRATACAGRVVLDGTAIHAVLAREAGQIVGALAGVKDVDNRIEVVRGPRGL